MYPCVFMRSSLSAKAILIYYSIEAFYSTAHCRHGRHSNRCKSGEKYIGPKVKNSPGSFSYNIFFCISLLIKWEGTRVVFYIVRSRALTDWGEILKKQIKVVSTFFCISLHSSTPRASLSCLRWAGVYWLLLEFTFIYGVEKALVILSTSNVIQRLWQRIKEEQILK